LRKLHSLSGLVPVGVFLLVHLWTNAKALRGQAAFDDAVGEINHLPYLPLLEAGILLPLAFHAGYGIKLAFEARPNVGSYATARNWMYTLQRVTGFVALAFLLFHLWEFRVQKAIGGMPISAFYPTLCAHLSSTVGGVPVVALVYLTGLAASVFHFANGVWGFLCSWGVTLSRRSQHLSALFAGALGIAVFLLGVNTTLYFATGARMFVPSSLGREPTQPHSCVDIPLRAPVAAVAKAQLSVEVPTVAPLLFRRPRRSRNSFHPADVAEGARRRRESWPIATVRTASRFVGSSWWAAVSLA
jgi:succinate dehydrogenase/fumarate reductase cytochrome b subunit (b558 family)